MNRKIVFFTNLNSINIFLKEKIVIPDASLDKPIKIIDVNENDQVVLLHDTSSVKVFDILNVDNSKVYIIHHNSTNTDMLEIMNDKENISLLFDHHEPAGIAGSMGYYEWMKNIVESDKFKDKIDIAIFNKIWDQLEETNQKDEALDLLHNILNGEIIKVDDLSEDLKEMFEKYYVIECKNKESKVIVTEYDDSKHREALETLRDAILKEKLANQN
jgi:hypothetical protein